MSGTEAARLNRIRGLVAAVAGAEWLQSVDGDGRVSIDARTPDGALVTIATLDAKADADETALLVGALEHVRFLLELVERAIRALQKPQEDQTLDVAPDERPSKDYAAEAAMKCAEPAFKIFLEERHGLERPLTDDRVAQKVRSLCGVTSRRELNAEHEAAAHWRDLVRDFDAWRRASR